MTASTSSKNNKSLIQSQIHQWVMCALVALMMITTNIFIVTDAFAEEPVSKSRRGVAIGSHDTVAYHSLSRDPHAKAVAGKKSWVVEYLGAKWRFASKESADLFKANPEKYKPAYNGYCANALSIGNGLVKTNGKTWEIFGEQLFLFYAEAGRKRWLSTDDIGEFKAVADAEWERLSR